MDEEFIILDYTALIDNEDDQKKELAEINEKENEVKMEAKENNEPCYL